MSDTPFSKTSNTQKDATGNPSMSFMFFFGRAQKIATAIYLITGLLKDTEPLREEIRTKAIGLLSSVRTLSDNHVDNERAVSDIRNLLEHTLSLSGLASRAGLVSLMNHEFLAREIESFVSDLIAAFKEKDTPALAASLKDAERPLSNTLLLATTAESHKGHDKGQSKGHAVIRIKKTARPIFGDFKQMTGPIKDIPSLNGAGIERKEKIYRIIQEKGSLTIKDIAQVAPQYSEKTIQRDLVEMVASGKVKKKGERRWTVYFV